MRVISDWLFCNLLFCAISLTVLSSAAAQDNGTGSSPVQIALTDSSSPYKPDVETAGIRISRAQLVPSNTTEQTFFLGIDGSKQPQDFGTNAHLGMQTHLALSGPLVPDLGIGYQVGGGITAAANAVQVFELLGENSGRVQAFSTAGLFQRFDSGLAWGVVWDYQYQESFDNFSLNQVRIGASQILGTRDQVGVTVILPASCSSASFNATTVRLDAIAQGRFFWRRFWDTSAQTTCWAGLAEGHSEENIVTGSGTPKDEVFLFGADILAPLNDYVAIYGEANLMMPPDTGAVDAFLGLQFYRGGGICSARRRQWSPLLPVASNTSMTVDLNR